MTAVASAANRTVGWVAPAAVGAGALVGCIGVRALSPTDSGDTICPFKAATGLDCPACGGLRSVYALTNGDVGVAADHNLLFIALLPVLAVAYGLWLGRSVGFSLPAVRLPRWWIPALVAAVAVFWGFRLLPWAPFEWLGSTQA